MKRILSSTSRWKHLTGIALAMFLNFFFIGQALAQDECAVAVTLTPAVSCTPTAGTNVGATQSIPSITCGIFTSNSALDVWYKFTATAVTHTVTVAGGTGFDAIIDVRSGACNGTNIACADATTGGGIETVTVGGLVIGQTYLVRVYGWNGGTGTFTICVTTPVAVANDECASATNLTPGSTCTPTAGTNTGATQSIAPITCATFTSSSALDVWYKFTAVSTSHTVTVVGGTGFDAIIDVRSGACNGTNIGCADATTGGGTETVTVGGLTPGQVYLVRVYGWAGGTGTFTICVTTPAPANNECATATTLTPGASCVPTAGTTAGATQSIPAITCATFTGTADDDVWYQFTATSTNHNVTVVGGTGFDAVVDVRSGACTGTNIGCADATISGGTETVVLSGLTVGATYLIRVYSFTSLASGQGSFNICVTTPASAPANNECATATTLTPGASCVPTAGTTVGATQSIPAITCASFTGTADDDVWYQFTATSANHTVTVVGGAGFDAVVDVRSGACNGTNIGCADATVSAGTETVVLSGLTVGATYFVRVYSFGSSASNQGTFTICVTTPAPANNECATATTLTPGATCVPTAGTTIGATQSIPAITCATFTGTADDDVWYQFTATSTNHTVTVVGGTGFDAVVDVRSGACNGTNIGCADATLSAGTETVVLSGLTAGATYFVRVYSFGSSASSQGTFNICVTTPSPANNDCATATTLTPGTGCVPTAGTTVGATQSIPAITCNTFTGTADDDVWYQFTATSASHNVTVTGGAGFDAVVDVRTGACTGTNIGCADATTIGATETVQLTGLTVGSTYLVRVYSFGSSAGNQGTFSICVTTPGIANDDCVSGVALTPGVSCSPINGTTINATQSLPPATCSGFSAAQAFDAWYKFTATSPNHTVIVDGAANMDAVVEVRTGACSGTSFGCIDATTADGTETVSMTGLTVGTTYLVRVYDFFSSGGDYTICVTTQAPSCMSNPTSPTNGQTNMCPSATTTLTWPSAPGATSYDVYFGTTNPPPFVTTQAGTSYVASTPAAGTYFWQIRPIGAGGTSVSCVIWSFTKVDGSFTLPANGASQVACPALIVQPTPPTVTTNCGTTVTPTGPTITDAPNPITCEGTRTYTWTYNNGFGQISNWSHVTTVERNPFTVPANGAAQVACPALAVTPTPPVVTSNCGETLPAPAPVITNVPNPIACEGTRTYAYTYTDCEGNTATWSFVYTIERNPFTVPANTAATVACPSAIVQPVPPTVLSNCGETITPTGPVIVNSPNPITCEGTRTYTWTYTDCEGNTATWSHVVTVERLPFGVPPNGGITVACPDQTDAQPTPPVVTSNCGEVLTPVVSSTAKPGCEGNRNWDFTYTDCEGNVAVWTYIYIVEYLDFTVPASETVTVECPLNATQPIPPVIHDNCNKLVNPIGPAITSTTNAGGCEASRKYAWTYADCEGNTHTWSKTYNFAYTADFFVPANEELFVGCLIYAQPPFPQTLYDICGQEVTVIGPTITEDIAADGCSGVRKYSYIYVDCSGHNHPWSFTYTANDNEPPVGNCPGGSLVNSVDVTNLSCISDVPCPGDYDFGPKMEQLLDAGGFYDVCSGDDLTVTLDSWSALWQCSDTDGNGVSTFGRTFYFRIADACGNEYPSLCGVTYSGLCQPIETFTQNDWGVAGGEPGMSTPNTPTDLQILTTLLGQGPFVVGGGNRSLTFTDAQCIVNLLPGIGNPAVLGNCNQVNCAGCNPAGPAGMKNILAANTTALMLNMRYNVQYNGLTMANIRNQSLGCVVIDPNIKVCAEGTGCKLRVFELNGTAHDFPYTIGGLLDLANLYLGGNLTMNEAPAAQYATALNNSLQNVNLYWHLGVVSTTCNPAAGVTAGDVADKALPTGKGKTKGMVDFSLAPNPAGSEVTFKLAELPESQAVVFEIYNSLGQQILRRDFGKVSFVNERIDLGGIGSGLYIVSVKTGGQRFEQKLVISKD